MWAKLAILLLMEGNILQNGVETQARLSKT
jgi:hypothetical protein